MSRLRLLELLQGLSAADRQRVETGWGGGAELSDSLAALAARMQDRTGIESRWQGLDATARALLQEVLGAGDDPMPVDKLGGDAVAGSVEALTGIGFLFTLNGESFAEPHVVVAEELDATLRQLARPEAPHAEAAPQREPFTLKQFLDERHFRTNGSGDAGDGRAAQHARQAYKLFLMPAAVEKRVRRLPDDVRELVDLAVTRFGGLLPKSLLAKARGDDGEFARPDLNKILTDGLIGRIGHVDLRAFGIQLAEDALCVFQEVCLVQLRANAQRRQPAPKTERVAGVDLATNLMRFLRYVDESPVRYTVEGEIFKATKKRMIGQLVPAAGEDAENSFRFIYRFALSRRLVERTGERRLGLSDNGRAFEERELPDKLKELLGFAVEDPHCGGDPFHQVKLRRILLRLLRRLEPDVWYDAMYVPFLARNSYLTQLGERGVAEYYAAKQEKGFTAIEDTQQLAWNLFHWVRKRLHLLGIVDLGFDGSNPVALRLSQLGATLLAGAPAQAAEGARSTLVVNPDFEILLFPEADAFELVHTLDRFSKRISSDRLFRFQITEAGVRSALADGMGISEILGVLTDRSRTPLPQNVLFSLTDWGDRAGALSIDEAGVLQARRPEVLDRLLEHRRIRELTRTDSECVALREDVSIDDFRVLLRDLGFFLEQRSNGSTRGVAKGDEERKDEPA